MTASAPRNDPTDASVPEPDAEPEPLPKLLRDPVELTHTSPFVDRPEYTAPAIDQTWTTPYVDRPEFTLPSLDGVPLIDFGQTAPWRDVSFPPTTSPFVDATVPEPEPWSPFPQWLLDLFDGPIRPSGQFGDPWGVDIEIR